MAETDQAQSTVHLPRVVIRFCVQCKWNLRAAYYAQELLQTFSDTLGEIALVPVTGGVFTITLQHTATASSSTASESAGTDPVATASGSTSTDPASAGTATVTTQIWDRKTDGGFPETKELKNRVRNLVDPERGLGHIDRSLKKGQQEERSGGGRDGKDAEKVKHEHEHERGGGAVEGCEECRQAAAESVGGQ